MAVLLTIALASLGSPADSQAAPAEPAEAAPAAVDAKEQAKQLAQDGRELFWKAEYPASIEAFSRAYELAADPNLLFNISSAYEKLGEPSRALEYLDRYAPSAPTEEAPAIEAKRRELEAAIRAAEAEPEPAAPVAHPDGPAREPVRPMPEEQPHEPLMSPMAWTFAGLGIAGLGVGVGFGASALSLSRSGEDACNNVDGQLRCPESAQADLDAARRRALAADIGFGIAIAGLIATVTVIGVRASKRKKSQQARVHPLGWGVGVSF